MSGGVTGNALICEACNELWAGVARIWSLNSLTAESGCTRPGGRMTAGAVPLSLHKHVRSTLLEDVRQTPLAGWNVEEADHTLPPEWTDSQRRAGRLQGQLIRWRASCSRRC